MSTATVNIREIFARIECGICGVREAKALQTYIHFLVYELAYSETTSWFQCRFCHRKTGEGHDEDCPGKDIE